MAPSTDDSHKTADNVQDVRVKLKRHRRPRVFSKTKIKPSAGDVLVNILLKVMTLATKAASVLGFRVLPTSILVFVAYAAIFLSLTITDILPKAPALEKQRGLDLDQAYEDLHHIAAKPHPYIAHANDNVRAYILSRLLSLAEKYPHVHVSNDLSSNASWFSPVSVGRFGVYFEGTNVLVKVDGTAHDQGEGQGEEKGAVLFSAHYDSVSTATGATDDGMGVVTLLQLVQYFAERRSVRTAVFNVNNGEEDGLHGAHAFLEHPWSDLTETFLNLEGAAAGGRPILFRATSTTPVRSFRNKRLIPHPHANVLSSDAFSRGLIRSSTDFSVYSGSSAGSRSTSNSRATSNSRGRRGTHMEAGKASGKGGMQGLDLAFYKGRAWYHTKYDAVQHTVGGKDSLWSMLEVARGVASGLLDEPFDDSFGGDEEKLDEGKGDDDPVYFDLFKATIVVFRLATLLTFNIVLLIAGPVVLVALFVIKRHFHFLQRQGKTRDQDHQVVQAEEEVPRRSESIQRNGVSRNDPPLRYITRSRTRDAAASSSGSVGIAGIEEPEVVGDADTDGGSFVHEDEESWMQMIWRHAKFWVALVGVFGMQVLLMWCYVAVNPFAIYSSPYVILFSFMSLSYLVMVFALALPLTLSQSKSHPIHIHSHQKQKQHQKQTTFIHLYILTYLLLVLATLGITKLDPGVGGGYVVSAWNLCVGVGCVLGGVEGIVASVLGKGWKGKGYEGDREGYEELRGAEGEAEPDTRRDEEEVDERTPLISGRRGTRRRDRRGGEGGGGGGGGEHEEEGASAGAGDLATWWWIPQFLVSVPFPVILLGHIAMLLLDSVPQTLTDGADPWGVYSLTLLLSITLILPLAPFAYKLRPSRLFTYLVLMIFLSTTVYALLAFPFYSHAPIKVYFQQRVEFPFSSSSSSSSTGTARYDSNEPVLRPKVFTAITGPERYLLPNIVRSLPSAEGKEVSCKAESTKPGLVTCEWETGPRMWPSPGSYVPLPVDVDVLPHQHQRQRQEKEKEKEKEMPNGSSKSEWKRGEVMKAQAVRTGETSAVISVKGRNTRACRVYFDEASVERYVIWPDGGSSSSGSLGSAGDDVENGTKQRAFAVHSTDMQDGYEIGNQGVESLRLWSRTWEREFRVEIHWAKTKNATDTMNTPGMKGRIACEWSEYESGLVDNGALYEPQEARIPFARVEVNGTDMDTTGTGAPLLDEDRPRIPAFEEVLTFLPEWATVSKFSDGLVEAWVPFAV